MRSGSVYRAIMLIAVGFITLLGLSATPAAAHNVEVRLTTSGGTLIGSATVVSGHTGFNICDPRREGTLVRVHYYVRNSSITRTSEISDRAGCVRRTVTSTSNPVVRFRVCSRGAYSGCTATVRA